MEQKDFYSFLEGEDVTPSRKKIASREIMGYAFNLPREWEEQENASRGKVLDVEILPLKSYTSEEILLTVSLLEIPGDSKKSLDMYLAHLEERFKDKDLHSSSSNSDTLDTYVLRILDGELVILKVIFYEQFRGYLQFDFIFKLTAAEQISPVVQEIVNSVR